MKTYIFKVDQAICVEGRDGRICRIIDDEKIQIEMNSDGSLQNLTRQELLTGYSNRKVKFIDPSDQSRPPRNTKYLGRPLSSFPEQVQEKAIRKKQYLDFILKYGKFVSTPKHLNSLIAICATELQDVKAPSPSTVSRWYLEYQKNHRDPRALVDRHHMKGGTGSRLHPEVLRMLEEVIDDVYLNQEKQSVLEVHSALEHAINICNAEQGPKNQLSVPSQATVYRAINSLDKYDAMVARDGAKTAEMTFRTSGASPKVSRLLERVEIDHTPLDLFVVDEETGMPMGRPTVTCAIDKKSRMIIGLHIGFQGVSMEAVFACLRHALIPKSYVKADYPSIENDWPCYGVIEVLICDNGLEFHAKELERVAFELDMQIQFCPRRQAYYKGAIERFFRSLNHQFARAIPGHSFDKWFKREDYDPLKHAVCTFDQLNLCMHKWIIDVYAQKIHRGLNSTPYLTWMENAKKIPTKLLPDIDRLDVSLGRTVQRTIFHYGIELNHVYYNGPSLLILRRRHGERVSVDVRYFFDDISHIYVIDPISKESVYVPAVDQDYAQGLTLIQHNLIRERVRLENKSIVDSAALAKAKHELRSFVRGLVVDKALRKRKSAAKIRGIGKHLENNALNNPTSDTRPVAPALHSKAVDVSELPSMPVVANRGKKQ